MVARWLYERPQFLGHTYFSGNVNNRFKQTKEKKNIIKSKCTTKQTSKKKNYKT